MNNNKPKVTYNCNIRIQEININTDGTFTASRSSKVSISGKVNKSTITDIQIHINDDVNIPLSLYNEIVKQIKEDV